MSESLGQLQNAVELVVKNSDLAAKIVLALQHRFGGHRVYIPKQNINARNRAILDDINRGLSIELIAARYKISERTVRRVLS